MLKLNKFSSIILIVICSCLDNSEYSLVIGDYKVDSYIYERSLRQFLGSNSEVSEQELLLWKNEYLQKQILIADAQLKGYDTLPDLLYYTNAMAEVIMTQRNGILWRHKTKDLLDSVTNITDCIIKKRTKTYCFEKLIVNANKLLTLYDISIGDRISRDKYINIKESFMNEQEVELHQIQLKWPFTRFWSEKGLLECLNINQGVALDRGDGKLEVLFLTDKLNSEYTKEDEEMLINELMFGTELDYEIRLNSNIYKCADIHYNKLNIEKIVFEYSEINPLKKKNDDGSLELMSYKYNGGIKLVTKEQFTHYYKYLPLKRVIDDKNVVFELLNDMYKSEYLCAESKELGLFDLDTFKLQKENYLRNIMYNTYVQNEIIKDIQVDSSEVELRYESSKFEEPQTIVVNKIVLTSIKDVSLLREKLSQGLSFKNTVNDIEPSHILSMELGKEIGCTYATNLEQNVLLELKRITDGETLILPESDANNIIVFHKVKSKDFIISDLKDVYGIVEQEIIDEKVRVRKKQCVQHFLLQHPINQNKISPYLTYIN